MSSRPVKHEKDALDGASVTGVEAVDHEKELREFAYVVSHDLSAPARHVKQFTQLLCRRLEPSMGADEKKHAEILLSAADRMQDMLAALLAYSRLMTKERRIETFDLKSLVESVASRFPPLSEDPSCTLKIGELGAITADKADIEYVFAQLLDNSLKFHDAESPLVIEISRSPTKGGADFIVCDNGPGIEPDQFESAFRLFQKLHVSDYPGMGVGLPMSRKAIEIHGGRMELTNVSNGTAVLIFLPSEVAI